MPATNPSTAPQHTSAWVTFTYASFLASLGMIGVGLLFLPLDIWIKGYFLMGTIMLVQSCITMTKTLRDVQESGRLVNRIEEAKTERILMGLGKE